MAFSSMLSLKKGYSYTENTSSLPLQPKTLNQSVNFDTSFKGMEMDVMGLTMKKKESYGDRFIPSGIRTNAYDMME